ncbi:MAG: recombination mediator RecR [Varibaculum sp.]|nr:recombination mediator RecR [Varibaculum sp.]
MYTQSLQDLIDALGALPGIGPKSAQRIAFHILSAPTEDAQRLADSLLKVKHNTHFCEICGNISESQICDICSDTRRDQTKICVVEEPKDVGVIERTRAYNGLYHVLGGAIDPINGIGPDQLRIRGLLTRLGTRGDDDTVTEVIIATDPNIEGEATATYLSRTLGTLGIDVTRLASGLPVGGDLEYADEVTLGRAFEGRRAL